MFNGRMDAARNPTSMVSYHVSPSDEMRSMPKAVRKITLMPTKTSFVVWRLELVDDASSMTAIYSSNTNGRDFSAPTKDGVDSSGFDMISPRDVPTSTNNSLSVRVYYTVS